MSFFVLNYHAIVGNSDKEAQGHCPYTMSKNNFLEHLKTIHTSGVKVLDPRELHQTLSLGIPFRKQGIFLSFYGAHCSDEEIVMPALKHYNWKAMFFPTAINSSIKDERWEMYAQMHTSGHTIGSCGSEHLLNPNLDEATLINELQQPKDVILSRTGSPCHALAYPYRHLPNRVLELTKKMGYKLGFTNGNGWNTVAACPHQLSRFNASRYISAQHLQLLLRGNKWASHFLRMSHNVKHFIHS